MSSTGQNSNYRVTWTISTSSTQGVWSCFPSLGKCEICGKDMYSDYKCDICGKRVCSECIRVIAPIKGSLHFVGSGTFVYSTVPPQPEMEICKECCDLLKLSLRIIATKAETK